MGWFEGIVSMDGRLKGRKRSDRRLIFTVAVFCFTLMTYSCVTTESKEMTSLLIANHVIFMVTTFAILVQCLCRSGITQRMMQMYVVLWTLAICLLQLHNQSMNVSPKWSLFVLVLDLSLVMRLGRSFSISLIVFVVLWVVLVFFDVQFRFGLLDLPGSFTNLERLDRMSVYCTCTDPPCAGPVAWSGAQVCIVASILVIDFLATRGFAEEAEKEQAAMAHTIETVEAAAQLLAGYDVDTVAGLLEAAEGRLPPAMHAALQRLEENLRSYRPYLPASLFERVSSDDEGHCSVVPVAAPGSEGEEATIVFTDVRASTSVWEAAPEAMQKAIRIHNVVVREGVALFNGYEVKTIGDAFMVAFEGPCAGVRFGLWVQEALLAAEWPAALLEVPICRRTELWGGLTVRVGVNHGPVVAELNTLTGRVDYFGHTVNIASRLESRCVPGAVAVPSPVWSQVGGACAYTVSGNEVAMELKGVSEALPVRHLWLAALAGRQYDPLGGRPSTSETVSAAAHNGRLGNGTPLNRLSRHNEGGLEEKHATVGVVSFEGVVNSAGARCISDRLEAVVPLLQQSRGTLVSLLGEHMFVGWNLVQPVPVHAETAIQFVRRALRVLGRHLTVGLASGTVYHGDVGTRSQRFMTVTGPAVSTSLLVWHTTHMVEQSFLYTPGVDGVLTSALQATLEAFTLVPTLVQKDRALGVLFELRHTTDNNGVLML